MRDEYPRPQFIRNDKWLNLNGKWKFTFDDNDVGINDHWERRDLPNSVYINVPFVYQSKLSGINIQENHEVCWYQREFSIEKKREYKYLLHFGAVDYISDVFIDGQFAGHHEGGENQFSFNITSLLISATIHQITVRVCDKNEDETIPRGKQTWTGKSEGIWYTDSSGIWQTVWIEAVPAVSISYVKITPFLDSMSVGLLTGVSEAALNKTLKIRISFKDKIIVEDSIKIISRNISRTIDLQQQHIFRTSYHNNGWTWTPENPQLFDVKLSISDLEKSYDCIKTYFGLRKISTENGMILLNNKPYYQKLVLDQGYWPDGLLTAPSDEAYIQDIKLAKEMGFNGCRKHQKVEDPRFLYWADKLGYLIWEEISSAPVYSENTVNRIIYDWQETISRDYNHPSIIMWVPLNESWGVDQIHRNRVQQHFSLALYHLLHALDNTRLVESNDGWDNTITDVVAIHNYSHGTKTDSKTYKHFCDTLSCKENLLNSAPGVFSVFAPGFKYQGQPIVLTEFGGVGFGSKKKGDWGYTGAKDKKEYIQELARIIKPIRASEGLWGYCYTQLTDVEQEINGLLTADRQPKVPIKQLNKIFNFKRIGRLKGDMSV